MRRPETSKCYNVLFSSENKQHISLRRGKTAISPAAGLFLGLLTHTPLHYRLPKALINGAVTARKCGQRQGGRSTATTLFSNRTHSSRETSRLNLCRSNV